MSSATLRLARAVLEDPDQARQMATRLLSADRQRRDRVRVKAAPRIVREKATKAQATENWRHTRELVLARAGGRCEFCGSVGFDLDCHHLAPGPLRKRFEAPHTVVAVCRACHNAWHMGAIVAVMTSLEAAQRIGAPDIVLAALNRRIDKVTK